MLEKPKVSIQSILHFQCKRLHMGAFHGPANVEQDSTLNFFQFLVNIFSVNTLFSKTRVWLICIFYNKLIS